MAHILGLDIGPHLLRGTLMRTQLRKSEIIRYVEAPIEVAPDQNGRAQALYEAMRMLVSDIGQLPEVVMCDLPGDRASIRTVQLPAAAARRAAEVLPFELESMLPFPVEDAVITHQPIRNEEGRSQLLAVAVRRDHVREHLDSLLTAGIDPRELAVGAIGLDGLVGLLPQLQESGPFVIVDIGERATDVCILHDGHCEAARTLSAGLDALEGGGELLRQAVHRTLVAYRASGGPEPERVYLAGARGDDATLCTWLAERLGVEVQPLPLPMCSDGKLAPDLTFARATALAGRAISRGKHINLRQGDLAPRRAAGSLRKRAGLLTACTAAVLVSMLFSIAAQRALLADEQAALRGKLGHVTEAIFGETAATVSEAKNLLENAGRDEDPLPRFDGFEALEVLTKAIPEEITHDVRRLRVDIGDDKHEGRLEIQGMLGSIEERDAVAAALAEHECIHELDKGRTTPAAGASRINYQIEAVIRCPGAGGTKGGEPKLRRRRAN